MCKLSDKKQDDSPNAKPCNCGGTSTGTRNRSVCLCEEALCTNSVGRSMGREVFWALKVEIGEQILVLIHRAVCEEVS